MRKKSYKGRCEKRSLEKFTSICKTYDPIQYAYANILVVKEGSEKNEGIQALAKALQSDEVRAFIDETYQGAVVAMF